MSGNVSTLSGQVGLFEFRENPTTGDPEYRKTGADTWSPFIKVINGTPVFPATMPTSQNNPTGTTLTCSNHYTSSSVAYHPRRMYWKSSNFSFWWSQNIPSESSPVWMQFEFAIPTAVKLFYIENGGRTNVYVKKIQIVAGNYTDSLEPLTDVLDIEPSVYYSISFGNKYHQRTEYKYYRLNVLEGSGGVSIMNFMMFLKMPSRMIVGCMSLCTIWSVLCRC